MITDKQYIICAAIHVNNDKTYQQQPKNITSGYVVCGRRHCNAIITNFLIEAGIVENIDKTIIEQGFMTSDDLFVSRKEAAKIAYKAGQIEREVKTLISEELY